MIRSTLSANRYPICNCHVMFKVEGEDGGRPPPACPHGQWSDVGGYGLPSFVTHVDKSLREDCRRRLEATSS